MDVGQNLKAFKKYCYYHCSTYKNKEGCSSHLISEKMIYDVVLDSIKKQIALLTEAEKIIKKNGMDTYKKVESRSLEQQLMALYEEVERYKDLKARLYQDMLQYQKIGMCRKICILRWLRGMIMRNCRKAEKRFIR